MDSIKYTGVGIDANGRSFHVSALEAADGGGWRCAQLQDRRCVVGVNQEKGSSRIWREIRAADTSFQRSCVPLEVSWTRLLHDNQRLPTVHSDFAAQEAVLCIAQAVASCCPDEAGTAERTLAIPNFLDEAMQDDVLQALQGLHGWTNVRLVWRPIAIALWYLSATKSGRESIEGQVLRIIDLEAAACEMTTLTLQSHKGRIVPVRDYPESADGKVIADIQPWVIAKGLLQRFGVSDASFADVAYGPYGETLQRALESGQSLRVWFPAGASWASREIGAVSGEHVRGVTIGCGTLQNRLESILNLGNLGSQDVVICHGWIARRAPLLDRIRSRCKAVVVADERSVALGAAIYSHRIFRKEPTYLDKLPQYGLWLERRTRGAAHKWEFQDIIPAGTVVGGGETYELPNPIVGVYIKEKSEEFPLILRRGKERFCRNVRAVLPKPLRRQHPVVICARMTPAGGNARVTISSAAGEMVFGKSTSLELNWKTMTIVEMPKPPPQQEHYGYPFIVQTRGRLENEFQQRKRLGEFLAQIGKEGVTPKKLAMLLDKRQQWLIPWGWVPGDTKSFNRGLFGPHNLADEEISRLAAELGAKLLTGLFANPARDSDYTRALGFMYCYSPSEFTDRLIDLIDKSTGLHQNHIIACGRVVTKGSHAEAFISRMLREKPGDSMVHGQWWSWAFMRFLCYYPDTIDVPKRHAQLSMEWLGLYLRHLASLACGNDDVDRRTTVKYCLSAILFGLRFREKHPGLLSEGDPSEEVAVQLERTLSRSSVQHIFPPTMFRGGALQPKPGDNLNKYVLRFLRYEETEEDRAAAGGLAAD